ncbi:MAG: hypothetical protein Q3972_00980 [Corynebacterium sp.]|nr:hypothetical protein [Corynebacterium sp.]
MNLEELRALPKVALGVQIGESIDASDLKRQLNLLAEQNVAYAECEITLDQYELVSSIADESPVRIGLILKVKDDVDLQEYLEGLAAKRFPLILGVQIRGKNADNQAPVLRTHLITFAIDDIPSFLAVLHGAHRIVDANDMCDDFIFSEEENDLVPGPASAFARDRGLPLAYRISKDYSEESPMALLQSMGFKAFMYSNDPTGSLSAIVDEHGFDLEDVVAFNRSMVEACWLPLPEREQLLQVVSQPLASLADPQELGDEQPQLDPQYELSQDDLDNIDPELFTMLGIDPSQIKLTDEK